jgi:exodeoxyribonuclease VII large subunit
MALDSSPESPLPVRTVARAIGDWVGRLGRVWLEGQVTEISRRPGAAKVFVTLRDPAADISLQLSCARAVTDAVVPPLATGARVVVWAKPEFYLGRGTLTLTAYEFRPVGVGELLARLERLKAMLAVEGLFAAERKRPLPFLPTAVGLICGRGSAAERDVCEHARRRWPAVAFVIRPVAVQGPMAVSQVTAALRELDRDRTVEVIVITRGGGSVEDLLPFSDESLCRAVAACTTPVVSAIGHEPDNPLLDLVADVRASTPTDAGRRVVPDVAEQQAAVSTARQRLRRRLHQRLETDAHQLAAVRSRPVLATPGRDVERRAGEVTTARGRVRRCVDGRLTAAVADLHSARARVAALSPAATLDRGYAVVQRADGAVLRRADEVAVGDPVGIRLAVGRLTAVVRSSAGPAAGSGRGAEG